MDDYKKQFVLNLLAYAVQREISPSKLCALSGIDFESLQSGAEMAISSKQLCDLWLNAAELSSDKMFGLHFGESLQLAALGAIGQIIQASKTVGEALTIASQSIHLITDSVTMKVTREKKKILISYSTGNVAEQSGAARQWLDFFMVFTIHEMDGLVLEKIKPLKVLTGDHASLHLSEYERVLRATPGKSNGSVQLEFDARYWDLPIITANYQLQQHLLTLHQQTSASPHEKLMSERVIDYLTANAYLGIASLEEIASNFNTSARSLQRKLRDEGVSFQQLADSVRKSIALHYLQQSEYPLKEISYLLGYNEMSAFTRAFRRWTGKSPVAWRRGRV